MAREFAMIVKESSYGVPMADPTLGTDAFYLRLSDPNSFTMQDVPIVGDIMYGGGLATPACAYSGQNTCTGQLSGILYAGAYAKFLADWGLTQINTGRTTPWVTTDSAGVMPPTDLASVSIYHAIQRSNGTLDRRRYGGVKVNSGSITTSSQDVLVKFSFQLQGIRDDLNAAGEAAYPDDTEFPAPAETDLPCGPYLFSHTGGLLKIATVRTQYDSVGIAWTSAMAPKWFESKYVVLNKFCGRNTKLSANLYMKASPDDLATLKALTKLDVELSFSNGTNSLKFDLNTNNLFSQMTRDLPMASTYSWNDTIQNYFDASTASDVVVSRDMTRQQVIARFYDDLQAAERYKDKQMDGTPPPGVVVARFLIGNAVRLKLDSERIPGFVTGFTVRQHGIYYLVTWGDTRDETSHGDFELERVEDVQHS